MIIIKPYHEVYEEKKEQWREMTKMISDGLSGYIYPKESEDGKWEVEVGNLPIGCPNCGRARVNFHPDRDLMDCEKCDWTSSAILDWDTKHVSHAVISLTKEQLNHLEYVLKNHADRCDDYNCIQEGRETRSLLTHIMNHAKEDEE